MIHATFNDKDLDPSTIVVSDTLIAVPADRIAVYAGDNVDLGRQNEIINGWKWLWTGVRDRNLLDVQFNGNVLYSGAAIDSLTEYNRRTASVVTSFTDDDIIIGLGNAVTGAAGGAIDQLKVAFDKLASAARPSLV
jgi:hypothetical protein